MSGRKIEMLPGTALAPETVLAQIMEDVRQGQIVSVYVGYKTKRDAFGACWSQQTSLDIVGHAKVAENRATRVFLDGDR